MSLLAPYSATPESPASGYDLVHVFFFWTPEKKKFPCGTLPPQIGLKSHY